MNNCTNDDYLKFPKNMTGFSFWVVNSLIEANEEVIPDTLGKEIRDASSFQMLPEIGESSFDVSSVNIPPDQIRTIENINTLVSEVPSTPYIFLNGQPIAGYVLSLP